MMTDDLFPTQGQVDELLRVNQSLQEAWVWQVVRNRRSSLARSARNVVKQLHALEADSRELWKKVSPDAADSWWGFVCTKVGAATRAQDAFLRMAVRLLLLFSFFFFCFFFFVASPFFPTLFFSSFFPRSSTTSTPAPELDMSEEAQRSYYRAKLAKLEKLSGATFPVPCPPELGPRLAKSKTPSSKK